MVDGSAYPSSRQPDPAATTVSVGEDFDGFYRREFPSMVALASSLGASPQVAEDLAQDAMVKAHRNWKKISQYDNPGTWVRRVTINLATSSGRRKTSEIKAKIRLKNTASYMPPMSSPAPEPIWDAVAALPPKQRAAIALHYLEDRPVKQIAEILECSPSTAKVHLHKARTRLAEILGAEGSPSHV